MAGDSVLPDIWPNSFKVPGLIDIDALALSIVASPIHPASPLALKFGYRCVEALGGKVAQDASRTLQASETSCNPG